MQQGSPLLGGADELGSELCCCWASFGEVATGFVGSSSRVLEGLFSLQAWSGLMTILTLSLLEKVIALAWAAVVLPKANLPRILALLFCALVRGCPERLSLCCCP